MDQEMRRIPQNSADLGRSRAPPGEDTTTGFRQFADQPIGLNRMFEPGFGPSIFNTGADRFCMDFLTFAVKQRQLAASLVEATLEIACL